MSIDGEIAKHLANGTLFVIAPAQPAKASVRDVIVSKDIWDMVRDDGQPPPGTEAVWAKVRAKLDSIVSGNVFVFGLDPTNKSSSSLVARVHPLKHRIIDLRVSEPKPAIRIFGGVVKRDAIILLTYEYRRLLKFGRAAHQARQTWNSLFPSHPPMHGSIHDQYFSDILPG